MNGKITKATFKSFVKKNPNLFIKVKSRFDGMTDCVEQLSGGFGKIANAVYPCDNNLGLQGVWLVGGSSRNRFYPYNDGKFSGIEVYNCCGSFIVATRA